MAKLGDRLGKVRVPLPPLVDHLGERDAETFGNLGRPDQIGHVNLSAHRIDARAAVPPRGSLHYGRTQAYPSDYGHSQEANGRET